MNEVEFRREGQFQPREEDIASLLDNYNIGPYTVDTTPLPGGIENTSLGVESETGNYVLRIYREGRKDPKDIIDEAEFMAYLASGGLPLPKVFQNNEDSYVTTVTIGGKPWQAILMQRAPGQHPTTYSSPLIENLATLQANMHLLGATYTPSTKPANQLPELAESKRDAENANLPELQETQFIPLLERTSLESNPALAQFIQRVAAFRVKLGEELPLGVSHFDYDKDNILANEQAAVTAILDFDNFAYAPLVVCLGYTMADIVATEGTLDKAAAYLAAYEQVRQLAASERAVLGQIMRFRHYVVSTVRVLDGQTTEADVTKMIALENFLEGVSL